MPIVGINAEKCTRCGQCYKECPMMCFKRQDKDIVFNADNPFCMACGHCIAVCPVDAIQWEGLGEYETPEQSNSNQVSYDELLHLIRMKRSCRRYKPDPLPTELIDKVFTAMQYAPSGHNDRDWIFTLMTDPVKIKEMSTAIAEEIIKHPVFGKMFGPVVKKVVDIGKDPIFFSAPAVIFMSTPYDTFISGNNAGVILSYGMLAAHTLGLATCWIGFAQIAFTANPELKKKVGLKGNLWGVMVLGNPDVKYHRAPPRKAIRRKEIK